MLFRSDRLDDERDDSDVTDMNGNNENELDISLGDYRNEDEIPDYKLREISERTEQKGDVPFSDTESLNEFLLDQLGLQELSPQQELIARYIIGNIDDDGYLRRDLSAIADDLMFQEGENVTAADVAAVLSIIQEFDPAGVGARNLQECLLLQLRRRKPSELISRTEQLLENYFDELSRKHFDKIKRGLNIDRSEERRVGKEC